MDTLLIASNIALWLVAFGLGFLLLGTLRSMGVLQWRLDQMEALRPTRRGREGLRVGARAPDFTLPAVAGGDVTLHDYTGRSVLLVFTQSRCGPCLAVMPELNRLQLMREHQVLVVNNGDPDATRKWADEVNARFPVLVQKDWALSRRFQIFATPFAFLIDERGVIASKGIAGSREYLRYVLNGAGKRVKTHREEPEGDSADARPSILAVTESEGIHV